MKNNILNTHIMIILLAGVSIYPVAPGGQAVASDNNVFASKATGDDVMHTNSSLSAGTRPGVADVILNLKAGSFLRTMPEFNEVVSAMQEVYGTQTTTQEKYNDLITKAEKLAEQMNDAFDSYMAKKHLSSEEKEEAFLLKKDLDFFMLNVMEPLKDIQAITNQLAACKGMAKDLSHNIGKTAMAKLKAANNDNCTTKQFAELQTYARDVNAAISRLHYGEEAEPPTTSEVGTFMRTLISENQKSALLNFVAIKSQMTDSPRAAAEVLNEIAKKSFKEADEQKRFQARLTRDKEFLNRLESLTAIQPSTTQKDQIQFKNYVALRDSLLRLNQSTNEQKRMEQKMGGVTQFFQQSLSYPVTFQDLAQHSDSKLAEIKSVGNTQVANEPNDYYYAIRLLLLQKYNLWDETPWSALPPPESWRNKDVKSLMTQELKNALTPLGITADFPQITDAFINNLHTTMLKHGGKVQDVARLKEAMLEAFGKVEVNGAKIMAKHLKEYNVILQNTNAIQNEVKARFYGLPGDLAKREKLLNGGIKNREEFTASDFASGLRAFEQANYTWFATLAKLEKENNPEKTIKFLIKQNPAAIMTALTKRPAMLANVCRWLDSSDDEELNNSKMLRNSTLALAGMVFLAVPGLEGIGLASLAQSLAPFLTVGLTTVGLIGAVNESQLAKEYFNLSGRQKTAHLAQGEYSPAEINATFRNGILHSGTVIAEATAGLSTMKTAGRVMANTGRKLRHNPASLFIEDKNNLTGINNILSRTNKFTKTILDLEEWPLLVIKRHPIMRGKEFKGKVHVATNMVTMQATYHVGVRISRWTWQKFKQPTMTDEPSLHYYGNHDLIEKINSGTLAIRDAITEAHQRQQSINAFLEYVDKHRYTPATPENTATFVRTALATPSLNDTLSDVHKLVKNYEVNGKALRQIIWRKAEALNKQQQIKLSISDDGNKSVNQPELTKNYANDEFAEFIECKERNKITNLQFKNMLLQYEEKKAVIDMLLTSGVVAHTSDGREITHELLRQDLLASAAINEN